MSVTLAGSLTRIPRLPQYTNRGVPVPDYIGSGGCRGPLFDPCLPSVTVTARTELRRGSDAVAGMSRHVPALSSVRRVAICSNNSMLCRYLRTPGRYGP